jgi:acetolactate synthase-1/2/3 large subunit
MKNKTLKKRNKTNNSKLLWNILLSKNIKIVFGVPSSSIDGILNYIPSQIKWVNTGLELQNGFISQVYGSYTNNVGILFTGTGPSIATAISSIKNAECENKPLLVITTFEKRDKIDFQYWELEKVSRTIIKYIYHIKKSSEMKDTLLLAYETAKIYNTAVILIIDEDILLQPSERLSISNKLYINEPSKSYINKTKNDLTKLNNTKLLVVISTTNNRMDYNIIRNFIKKNNLPYVTTWKARTIYKDGLYCGRIGSLGNHSANYALYNCDNILIIGDMIEYLQYNDKEYHYDMFSIPFINYLHKSTIKTIYYFAH